MATISANLTKEEKLEMDEYCKNNNISKNDIIKNGIKNQMNQESPGTPITTGITEPLEPKKNLSDTSISKINEEIKNKNEEKIYSKDDIKNQIKPQIKKDTTEEVINHMKNKNCGSKCNICNTRDSIKNTAMKNQENNDIKIINKKINENNLQDQIDYGNGIIAGIKSMKANSDKNTKDVYEFALKRTKNNNYNYDIGLKNGINMTKQYPNLSGNQIMNQIIKQTITN